MRGIISPKDLIVPKTTYGVYANMNGSSHFFVRNDPDFPESGITGDLTIQAWINLDDLVGSQLVMSKWETAGDKRMFVFRVTGGELTFINSSDGTSSTVVTVNTSGVSLVARIWTHVVVVYDAAAGTADFYKNGSFVEQETGLKTSMADLDALFYVGGLGGAQTIGGGLSNVALFDDKRTAPEISLSAADFDENLSGAGNLIAQWMFDDDPAVTGIDNSQGDSSRDLLLRGGVTTNYGTHTRVTGVVP